MHLDTSGHHDLDLARSLLAARGRIILTTGLRQRPELLAGALYTRDAQIIGFVISNAGTAELAEATDRIKQLLLEGALRPGRLEKLPLSAAAEAHRRLETGEARGTRLLLLPPA